MSTFSGQVSQSTDDGSQNSTGTVTLTATVAPLAASTYAAFRFQNVTIPPGATISAASLSIWLGTSKIAINSTIYGNKVANPSTLAATTSYISGLAQTTNSVSWSNSSLSTTAFNASPSIAAIITELIGQAGWASGNSIVLILVNSENLSFAASSEMYDGTPSEAAELSITYTGGGGGGGGANQALLTLGCG